MKKILSILGTITLIVTSTTSLAACNTKYTETELKELKEENKININGNTLEWIAPQEKPFKQSDDKWYFVIWRVNKNDNWRIVKFKNNINIINTEEKRNLDNLNGYYLNIINLIFGGNNLSIFKSRGILIPFIHVWSKNDDSFKAVYRFNDKGEPDTLIIDPKTGEVINWKEDKEVKKDK